MSLKSTNDKRWVTLAALLAVTVTLAAHAGPPGEKIQFSEPSTPVNPTGTSTGLTPGLNRLNPAPSAFKQVQEDLFAPLKNSMNSGDSMDGMTSLPPPSQPQRAVPTRRMKEQMDLRRNWAFAGLNDLYPEQTLENAAGLRDMDFGKEDKDSTSLIEKYYNNLGQKPAIGTNGPAWQNPNDPYTAMLNGATNGLLSRPFAPETDPVSKALFATNASWIGGDKDRDRNRDLVPGFKNAIYGDMNRDEVLAAKRRTEDFQRILDHSPEAPATGTPPGGNLDPYGVLNKTSPVANFNALLNPAPVEAHRNAINPVLGFTDPTVTALHTRLSDDPTAAALGLPNPVPPPPPARPDPIKATQRMLDPFSSVVQHPKF